MGEAREGRVGRVVALVVILGLVAAGCSSSGGQTGGTAATTPDDTSTSATSGAAPGSAALLAAVCDGGVSVTDAGTLTAPSATETSGIAASRRNPGVWWVHNDSGDSARIFAISSSADLLATVDLDGATATDWEDIAVGPPATGGEAGAAATIYVGDIGDNGESRPGITIYRLPEPGIDTGAPGSTLHVPADALSFTYPDGPHNAEALLVDPATGDLVIITKDGSLAGRSQVFRAPAGLAAGSSTVLDAVTTLDLRLATLVTGADVSPDGTVVALRSYDRVALYPRPAGQPVWAAFAASPCDGPPPLEKQGEAIGFSADGGSYATISEGEDPTLHLTTP